MITNIPTAKEYIDSGRKILGKSWSRITGLYDLWLYNSKRGHNIGFGINNRLDLSSFWNNSREDVAEAISNVQHGVELILKGRIIEINAFLIIKDMSNQIKSEKKADVDFRGLKSIDSSEIIKILEKVTHHRLSDEFKEKFEKSRKMRNQFMHSIIGEGVSDAKKTLEYCLFMHAELFPGESWIATRWVHNRKNVGYTVDLHHADIEQIMYREFFSALHILDPSVSKRYIGTFKKDVFYDCLACHGGQPQNLTVFRMACGNFQCYCCATKFMLDGDEFTTMQLDDEILGSI